MYANSSLKKYLNDLAAKLPAPGGGSACALVASLGASLISMVVNFTLGKPRYAGYTQELKATLEKSEKLRNRFLDLVDADVLAYKSKDIRGALDIPLMVCRLCLEGIRLCPQLIKKGNVNLISDVGVAAILLEAAFRGAYCNVEINLKSLGDKKLARAISEELGRKEKIIKGVRSNTEVKVGKIVRG